MLAMKTLSKSSGFVSAVLVSAASPAQVMPDPKAIELVQAALAAQGGEAKLRAIASVSWEAAGYRNALEQSERPEGPYVTEFITSSEVHDLARNRFVASDAISIYPVSAASSKLAVADGVAMLSNGTANRPGTADDVTYARERMALSPERLLLTALDAPSLVLRPDAVLQSVRQHVIRFDVDDAPVTVFLNADTRLPTAWDYSGLLARRGYWQFAGDVTSRTYWSFWWLAKGGVHLPMQWTVETNGLPDRMISIKRLTINTAPDEAAFAIPGAVRAAFKPGPAPGLEQVPLGRPNMPPAELRSGIVLLPGSWNVTIVKQDDGLVIIEAPISGGYSAKVMAEARRRYPGVPIKAIITTSDSWPHLAGIREYVAAGIPIYALARNRAILDRWIADPRTQRPDTLASHPRRAQFRWVSGRTEIGSGLNRIVLYPIAGETSERQMMAYFPQHHILYGSDPFQKQSDGSYFLPQTVSELTDAATREHLPVDSFFMMHMGLTPWTELPAVLARAAAAQSPDGRL